MPSQKNEFETIERLGLEEAMILLKEVIEKCCKKIEKYWNND